jgi:two-component system, cell cycle response regulator
MIERKWVPSLVERAKSGATRIMLVEAIESAHSLVPFLHAINNERAVIEIVRASGVADALDRIANQHCDVILLDLEFAGDATSCIKLIDEHFNIPIVTLTNNADDATALEAVRAGAEDHLFKSRINPQMLHRVIEFAMVRHRRQSDFQTLSFTDDLTGLYNRRGFMTVADQQIRIARRRNTGVAIAFLDLDGLKRINDQFGHSHGDLALKDVAHILKTTFRESDVSARIGGDEFAMFWTEVRELSLDTLLARLKSNVAAHLVSESRPYSLSLSIGFIEYCVGFTECLSDMLRESDRQMYQHKRRMTAGH